MERLDYILQRVEEKKGDYQRYDLSPAETTAFNTFFDLAQELDGIKDFYELCVAIPKGFFGLDAWFYLINPRDGRFMLVTATRDVPEHGMHQRGTGNAFYYTDHDSMVLNIRGKRPLLDQLPFTTSDEVLGLLEVHPASAMGAHRELFFEKYANRIGFNLHNRLLVEKNVEHLRFIRSLVADIEHNIIAPNIVYKLYLKNLEGASARNREIERHLSEYLHEGGDRDALVNLMQELTEVNRTLDHELDSLKKHHRNMSLFLEALLRRSHFDQGRLTLRTRTCNIKKEVLEPQFDRYRDRFRSMGIAVDEERSRVPDEENVSAVDIGLLAQVYANLFSNALKYTAEIDTDEGETQKHISYGCEVLTDYFGPGKDGLKYNVFSTGPHIDVEEREKIFDDQYRGSNIGKKPGSGHGLAFIKNVVEIHGGVAGYEATNQGNNFYFILPKETSEAEAPMH
jgi:signal transduction histidine kinase